MEIDLRPARREFLGYCKTLAYGVSSLALIKASLAEAASKTQQTGPHSDRDWKTWGKTDFKGVENETIPSFSKNFRVLNRQGICLDVEQAIRHGFRSTLCTAEVGLDEREILEFLTTVVHAAQGRIHVGMSAVFDTMETAYRMIPRAAQIGCTHVLLGYPPGYFPQSVKEVYDDTKRLAEAAGTSIGVVLYPKFEHPGLPMAEIVEAFTELATLPNVFAAKIYDGLTGAPQGNRQSSQEAEFFLACQKAFGHLILISSPNPFALPLLAAQFGQQWIGAGPYEVFQSPEKPFFVQLMQLLNERRFKEAEDLHRRLLPVMNSFMSRHALNVALGTYHWPEHKYYQWLTGGNGGYTRQPVMRLTRKNMDTIREDFLSLGITPVNNDDAEFFEGRTLRHW